MLTSMQRATQSLNDGLTAMLLGVVEIIRAAENRSATALAHHCRFCRCTTVMGPRASSTMMTDYS